MDFPQAPLDPLPDAPLDAGRLGSFDDGFCVVERLLDPDWIAELKTDVDLLAANAGRAAGLGSDASPAALARMSRLVRTPLLRQMPSESPRAHDLPAIGRLVWHPRIMAVLDQLMAAWRPRAEWALGCGVPEEAPYDAAPERRRYVFHHVNAARHDAGTPGLPWHHDYDQYPQTNRSHLMVHVLIYLNGLNGSIGDLMLTPGTQRSVASKRALWQMGWSELPGTVVIDELPPGSAVFMQSAMFHARRPKPGGQDEPRYFLDLSYCQTGIKWPNGYRDSHEDLSRRHLASGGDRPWLFDQAWFYDATAAHHLTESARGSLLADGARPAP